jgi:hypothetical protein
LCKGLEFGKNSRGVSSLKRQQLPNGERGVSCKYSVMKNNVRYSYGYNGTVPYGRLCRGKRVAFKNTLRVVSGPFGFALTGASVALALKENRIVHDYCKQNRGDDPSNWIEGEPQQYWCGVVSGRGLMLTMGVVAGGYYAKKTKPLIGTRIVSEVKDIQREILGSNLFGAKINGVNGQVVEIPKTSDWDVKITDNGNGKMYFDKNNQSGNWVRIHQEGRYSAFPKTYQNPYVKAQINGTPVLDIDGDEHIIISSLEI